ncbi:MAG: ABC transporter ATP-binding protein [Acidimicrobiales bacterium]|uniref:ABC transporter ATP-binding protein n=1 Tax=Candidatus Poriferisodalis multihospitum TaxID=2983191 RepID=UPI0013820C8A|nr:ABC transporter ATP-binding protein [Acidimicrobiales bacterium]MXY01445.1 ABC transporter ATP-binding protein [Acidimicrobiales bacterium]MXZ15442.1 ABC transporter ATP-binding protein [Acidimicrobiales bacterium]MYB82240.1 ABC transporter ATP-binding protein [Acidimicrobiales bacterium]MYG62070.1 ABC transporter ATP-binding protein [Acidimicrobiales bacterium]
MVTAAVDLQSLDVRLNGTHVLGGVNLAVSHGQWVNIIGPNGAGKTTLLRAVLGLVAYDGDISIEGLTKLRRAERARKVAYVPQTPVIPRGMLVADYVLLGRTPHRSIFAGETSADREIAADVLERLDLVGFGDRAVQSLSGGERQRTVLARALVQQADILLLDEPTTALDLGHQQDVLDLVDALRRERGLTVIATLHDLTLAARYGDQVAILAGGVIAQRGTPGEVLTVANIAEHFDAQVRVIDDPEGPVIVPTATTTSDATKAAPAKRGTAQNGDHS